MKWTKPKLRKMAGTERETKLEKFRDRGVAEAFLDAWDDVGGFDNFIKDVAEQHGGTARLVYLVSDPEIKIIAEPQTPGEIKMCRWETHCGHH